MALLQEGSSNVAFPNSMWIWLLLGIPTLVSPPCHSAGAEPACGMGEGPCKKPHFSAVPTLLVGWTRRVLQR